MQQRSVDGEPRGKGGRQRAMNDLAAVTEHIETVFPSLSPQLRQAARYVLDRPDDVALSSMRRVAARAGVHPSTMVRLAQALAFPGYTALREPFRQYLRGERRYAARARDLVARGAAVETAALLREVADLDVENIGRTFEALTADGFAAAVEALYAARRVHVVGLRKCFPVAHYFHYAYHMFRDNAVLVGTRGGLLTDELRTMSGGDAMLAISFSRYTRDTVKAAKHAAARGAVVIAITDSRVSPLATCATHVLIAAKESPSFFGSLVGALSLAQALIASLATRGGDDTVATLGETERHLDQFGTYWEDAPIREAQA